jgi:hypothetical protein
VYQYKREGLIVMSACCTVNCATGLLSAARVVAEVDTRLGTHPPTAEQQSVELRSLDS